MDGPDQDENGQQLVTRSSKIGSILKVLPRDKFTKLGQPAYPGGPLLSPEFLIRRNSEFSSHAHVFGNLVALLSLTYCCEEYGLDFSKWPDVHKQHFFHRCSQYYKKNSSSFPECIRYARGIVIGPNEDRPLYNYTTPDFEGSYILLSDLSIRMRTNHNNHISVNFHRFIRRDVDMHVLEHYGHLAKRSIRILSKQIFRIIVGYFVDKLWNETKSEATREYIRLLRNILGQNDDWEDDQRRIQEFGKRVKRGEVSWEQCKLRLDRSEKWPKMCK